MGEFFQGWRRKLGVATLMVACVFAVGWIRTYSLSDTVHATFGKTACLDVDSFRSNITLGMSRGQGFFGWRSRPSREDMIFGWNSQMRTALNFGWGGGAVDEDPNDPTRECEMWSCPVKLFGCEVYLRSADKRHRARIGIVIPYPSVVIPLTLLSAYLLLRKPRASQRPIR